MVAPAPAAGGPAPAPAPAAAADDATPVEFRRARERLRAAERATRDERAEQNDAQRTLGSLLSDSMARHRVTCVAIAPPGSDGPLQYARILEGGRRAVTLRTREDVLALLDDGVTRALAEVPLEEMPLAVPRLLRERARARGTPTPARVRLVARPPRGGAIEAAHTSTETRQLSEQYSVAVNECRATRAALKPLRAEMRRREMAAASTVGAE